MSDSLQPHGVQYARSPCPSPSPKVCPSLGPLYLWCYPAISSSGALFSFCPQSFPASGNFPMSWQFASGDQNTGPSVSVLPMSIQGWFPLWLTGLIFLLSRGLPGVFPSTTVEGINTLALWLIIHKWRLLYKSYMITTNQIYITDTHICKWKQFQITLNIVTKSQGKKAKEEERSKTNLQKLNVKINKMEYEWTK